MPGLGLKIVIIDAGTVLHFLELDDVLLLFRDPRLLRHFELVLPVVHDADDRGTGSGGDFDEIQPGFFRHPECRVHLENSELRTIGADHADRADADHAIDPHALGGVLNARNL